MGSQLDVEAGLKVCGGSWDTYLGVLGLIEKYADEKKTAIWNAYEAEDWDWYEREVHSLKSSMASIGAAAFAEFAKKHEFAAKDYNISYIRETVNSLQEEYDIVLAEIEIVKSKAEQG